LLPLCKDYYKDFPDNEEIKNLLFAMVIEGVICKYFLTVSLLEENILIDYDINAMQKSIMPRN